ncbi:MAG: glycosyltransferase, partial [Dehalococcoidia bacterium]
MPSNGAVPARPPVPPVHVAMVSTHAPRLCGIATFTADLASAIAVADPAMRISWAAISEEGTDHRYGPEVKWYIRQQRAATYGRAASAINASDIDVVSIQHEFGLYGDWDETFDDHLEPFLDTLERPLVTTFHTVLPDPSPSVLAAVRRIGERSRAVVVMAERARGILSERYALDPSTIHVIPHGVPPVADRNRDAMKARLGLGGRRVISTFGLVDPRKGLEYMIEAMAAVVRRHPLALYLLLGKTHPELVRRAGERYRAGLRELVQAHGLEDHVRFVDEYLTQAEIVNYLVASDVYVTPYLDPHQITSGTLSYALGAGKAIVSTPYAHAIEALDEHRGLLVDFRSAHGLAQAVTRVLDSDMLRETLECNASTYGNQMAWPAVGANVSRLYRSVLIPDDSEVHAVQGRGL